MNRSFLLCLLCLVALLLLAIAPGCGSGAPEIPPELLETDDDGNGSGEGAGRADGSGSGSGDDYPAGPYGTEVGDTLENFTFMGLRDPQTQTETQTQTQTQTELEPISFADFYDPDEEKGHTLLLFNTAAAWCQPCQIEHADLPDRKIAHEDQGLVIFSMLFQDESGDQADEEDLDAWITTFDTNFPMAIDPSYQMGRYGPAETPPLNLIVDPRDMTLVARFVGNQEGPMWALIESELEQRNQ